MKSSVSVRVPGTSANVGPGFDSLGIALSVYNTFTFERSDVTEIVGCDPAHAGEDNLVRVAFRRACELAGVPVPTVRITFDISVPFSRGLGSSATMIVGGALGARALLDLPLSDADVFKLATELEGHPDNVAPALFGGFTASLTENGKPYTAKCPVSENLCFCAFIPDYEMETHKARGVLPKTVPYGDAVFNAAHVAVLMEAMRLGDGELLRLALADKLHQPYRIPLLDGYGQVRDIALAAGADAFCISGSGSTLMAIGTDPDFPLRAKEKIAELPHNWRVLPLRVDTDGAVIF